MLESSGPVRLDVWLDVACLYKTRSEAQKACTGGKVHLNGQAVKPHRTVQAGDTLEITRSLGRRQQVRVVSTTDRHIAKSEARTLYEDITPKPSAEEQAMLDLLRLVRPGRRGPVETPDRRERRRLRREKEGDEPV